jgi:hypothetical protein
MPLFSGKSSEDFSYRILEGSSVIAAKHPLILQIWAQMLNFWDKGRRKLLHAAQVDTLGCFKGACEDHQIFKRYMLAIVHNKV